MADYNPKEVEERAQRRWEELDSYRIDITSAKHPLYVLDMFPYPSGEGLHVGHVEGYTATDITSRYYRMKGYDVLHPMGWDAFGLPAENAAIQQKKHPRQLVERNVSRFKEQLKRLGFSYDWFKELNTTDPEYYTWTQWIFLKLFKMGLAYEAEIPINWCPSCKTGLANEEVAGGVCERCGTTVEQKPIRQWMLRITKYADRLLEGLDALDWPEGVKELQRNWIGKSEGTEIHFDITIPRTYVLLHGYQGSPKGNFFPWLAKELERRGNTVIIPKLPNSKNPNIQEQIEHVLETVSFDEQTVLLGYSLGAVVALKVAEKLEKNIHKLVLVAGFFEPKFQDGVSRGFEQTFDWRFDTTRIRERVKSVCILRDRNDSVVPFEQAEIIQNHVGGFIVDEKALEDHFSGNQEPAILRQAVDTVSIFTTRPDTLFGATYLVLSPEHTLINTALHSPALQNREEVKTYIEQAKQKSNIERASDEKEKTGVVLSGISAIHPVTGEALPVWIADYVLASYGTAAVMAVPAHDERDFTFAKKFNLAMKEVVIPCVTDHSNPPRERKKVRTRNMVHAIVFNPKRNAYLTLQWKKFPWNTVILGGIEDGEDPVQAAVREVKEETGFTDLECKGVLGGPIQASYFANHKDENRLAITTGVYFELKSEKRDPVSQEEQDAYDIVWKSKEDFIPENMNNSELPFWIERIEKGEKPYTGEGVLINSGKFDGEESEEAGKRITTWLTKHGKGRLSVRYKLHDWVFSRQRYWGEPIPIIHCEECGAVPVPEKDLPVTLPDVEQYEPTGTGESPLAAVEEWVATTCPECGSPGKRETNTMPQWAGSCWYFLRFLNPKDSEKAWSWEEVERWLPVGLYVGGAEHAVLHLLYARFWVKVLYDGGYIPIEEPFLKLRNQGMILGPDGQKMSKSKGNVINPDDIVEKYGADTLRLYEMFLGPLEADKPWDPQSISGAHRFLRRVWILQNRISESGINEESPLLHRLIKKVGYDIEHLKYNTAIAAMMEFMNESERSGITEQAYKAFLLVLSPFAPHITEELWQRIENRDDSILNCKWPSYNESRIVSDQITLPVQVNGKVRGEITISSKTTEEDIRVAALAHENVIKHTRGKDIRRCVIVPGRLVNIVT